MDDIYDQGGCLGLRTLTLNAYNNPCTGDDEELLDQGSCLVPLLTDQPLLVLGVVFSFLSRACRIGLRMHCVSRLKDL